MKDIATETLLTLTDEQIVTRRRALGLAVAAVGATALAGRAAYAEEDTEGSDDNQDPTSDDGDAATNEDPEGSDDNQDPTADDGDAATN